VLKFLILFLALSILPPAGISAQNAAADLSLDALVSRALAQDADVALALAQLRAAEAARGADQAWRSSVLTLQSGLQGGEDGSAAAAASSEMTWSVQAALPLAHWLSLGAESSGDAAGNGSGAVSLTVSPFARHSGSAALNYRSTLATYRGSLRTAILDFRATLRSMVVADAELRLRRAELAVTAGALTSARILVERGEAGRTSLLDALADQTEAEVAVSAAESALETSRADLALRLDLAETALPETATLAALEAVPGDDPGANNMDLEQWLTASAGWQNAQLAAESAADEARLAVPRPDLSLKGTLGSVLAGTGAGTSRWSATAAVSLPLDLVYRDTAAAKADTAAARQKSADNLRVAAVREYAQKLKELTRGYETWRRATTANESAALALEEGRLLHSLGESSAADLAAAEADGLRSAWQTAAALKSLRDVQDQLDRRWSAPAAED